MSNVNAEKLMLTQQYQVMRYERTIIMFSASIQLLFSVSSCFFFKRSFSLGALCGSHFLNTFCHTLLTVLLKESRNALIMKLFCICFLYLSLILNWSNQFKVFNLLKIFVLSLWFRMHLQSYCIRRNEMLARFYRTRQWT